MRKCFEFRRKMTTALILLAVAASYISLSAAQEEVIPPDVGDDWDIKKDDSFAPPISSAVSQHLLHDRVNHPTWTLNLDDSMHRKFPSACFRHGNSTDDNNRYHLLACWLFYLQLKIPDQSFRASVFRLKLHNLQCSNTTLEALQSSYIPSSNNTSTTTSSTTDPSLMVNLQNVSVLCSGEYHESSLGLSGKLTAEAMGGDDALNVTLQLLSNDTQPPLFPDSVQTALCASHFTLKDLHFSGSTSARLVDLFRSSIASYVTTAIQQELCPKVIPKQLNPWLTRQLQLFRHWAEPYLPQQENDSSSIVLLHNDINRAASLRMENKPASLTEPLQRRTSHDKNNNNNNTILVDFTRDAPFLKQATDSINHHILEPYLHHGFLPHTVDTNKTSCGYFFDGWNGILQSTWPNGYTQSTPRWRYHWSFPGQGLVTLQIHNVTGFTNQWNTVQMAQIQNATVLHNQVDLEELSIRAAMTVLVQVGNETTLELEESFDIQVNASDISALLDIDVGLDAEVLQESVSLQTMWDLVHGFVEGNVTLQHEALQCLIMAVDSLQASNLIVSTLLDDAYFTPHDSNDADSSNELEHDLDALINNLLELILHEYKPLISDLILGLMTGPVQEKLNTVLRDTAAASGSCSDGRNSTTVPQTYHFTKILSKLNRMLRQESTLSTMNGYMDCVSDFIANTIEQHFSSRGFLKEDGGNGASFVRLRSLQLLQTGSINRLELLAPPWDNATSNSSEVLSTQLSYGNSAEQPKLALEADIRLYEPLNFTGTLAIEVGLDNLEMAFGSGLSYEISDFDETYLWQLLQHGECVVAPMGISYYDASGSIGDFGVKVNISGDSWSGVFIDSRDYPFIHEFVADFLNWTLVTARDWAMESSSLFVDDSYFICNDEPLPSHESDKTDEIDYSSMLLIFGAVLLLAQPALLLMKTNTGMNSGTRRSGVGSSLTEPLIQTENDFGDGVTEGASQTSESSALMYSPKVDYFTSVATPVLILSTIALLITSNLSIGATVDVVVDANDHVFRPPPLFAFSLINTAKEMLQARIYPLFVLIVVFSGIWPYVKLLLLLFAWVAPRKILGVKRRGRLLLALDALGKFSLVDTYVLVLMVVAFRYRLDIIDGSLLDVFVTPQFGFYGFLLATTLSLAAGHIVVYSHRNAELRLAEGETPNEPLIEHSFRVGEEQRQLSRKIRYVLAVVFILACGLLGTGITRESFIFEFGGLAGLLIGEQRQATYSLLSLGASISISVENPASLGILFLQMTYYFFAVVMPLACLLSLAMLLVIPMSIQNQLVVLTVAEISNAWSAVEVFAISILAALFEISTFASFILGSRCDLINEIINDHQGEFGELTTCYSVSSSVSADSGFLVLGVILNSAWVSFVLRLVHLGIDERIRRTERQSGNDDANSEDSETSFVEQMASHRWMRWTVTPAMNVSFQLAQEDGDVSGPPVFSEDREPQTPPRTLPWLTRQNEDIFDDDWRNSAEKDPAWKEWKEATNVT